MANEVIIEEYGPQKYETDGKLSGASIGKKIATQVLNIGSLSAPLNQETSYVIVQSKGAGFWMNEGASDVTATANADGNRWVPTEGVKEFPVTKEITHVNTAADA